MDFWTWHSTLGLFSLYFVSYDIRHPCLGRSKSKQYYDLFRFGMNSSKWISIVKFGVVKTLWLMSHRVFTTPNLTIGIKTHTNWWFKPIGGKNPMTHSLWGWPSCPTCSMDLDLMAKKGAIMKFVSVKFQQLVIYA